MHHSITVVYWVLMLLLAASVFLTCVCSVSSGKGALSWQQRHVAAVYWHARAMVLLSQLLGCSASPAWTCAYRVYGCYSFELGFLSSTYVAALIEPTYLMKAAPECEPAGHLLVCILPTLPCGDCS
jgi:hypothetical protein